MIAYRYNNKNGVYLGEVERQEDPMNPGVYLMPANSTDIEPPEATHPYVPIWNGDSWNLVEDHRRHLDSVGNWTGGTPYWLPAEGDNWQSDPRYMKELGPLPEGAVTTKPEKTEIEIQKEQLEETISESKTYLNDTDYRVLKFMDKYIQSHPEVLAEFEEEYPDTLSKRQEARDNINGAQASAQMANISLTN